MFAGESTLKDANFELEDIGSMHLSNKHKQKSKPSTKKKISFGF